MADENVKWSSRSLYPKDGGTVDVLAGVDKATGAPVVRTTASEIPWSDDLPGFSYQSSSDRLADNERWRHVVALKKESLANPTKEPEQIPDLNLMWQEGHEYEPLARKGHVTFSGLGGLLGPKGALTKKDN